MYITLTDSAIRLSNLRLAYRLLDSTNLFSISGVYDPITIDILRLSAPDVLLWEIVAATTCVRFSDTKKIKLNHLFCGKDQILKQGKTGNELIIKPVMFFNQDYFNAEFKTCSLAPLGYSQCATSIRLAITKRYEFLFNVGKHETHLFRYLRTNWLLAKGYKPGVVTELLGHVDPEVWKSYFNPIINNYFIKFLRER